MPDSYLEAKVVVIKVSIVDDGTVKELCILYIQVNFSRRHDLDLYQNLQILMQRFCRKIIHNSRIAKHHITHSVRTNRLLAVPLSWENSLG